MSHTAGLPLKFQKNIQYYRGLYQSKNLQYVRNNEVFYWRFLAHLEDIGYRPRTVQRYHEKLKTFLKWLGKTSICRVRKQQIEQFLLWFKEYRQREAYTLRYVRQALSVFFSFVMRYSRMKRNPACGLRIRTHFPQPERIEVFSQPEVIMITRRPLQERERLSRSDCPTDYSYRKAIYTLTMRYLMIKLMFSTGIRPWELVHVEVNDLEAELKQVIDYLEQEVYQTKNAEQISSMVVHFRARRDLCLLLWFVLYGLRLSEMACIRLDDIDSEKRSIRIQAKGNRQVRKKHRTILIEEVGWKALRAYLKVRRYPGQPYLWISWNGSPLRAHSLNNLVHQRVRKAGIQKPVSPHALRTTCASLYVSKGMDPYSLKSLLGHESLKTTMDHYARLTEEQLREVWKNTNPLAGFDDE